MAIVLHGYWRSGPSYRVRIGLHLKGLAFEQSPVNLLEDQHKAEGYAALNPQKLVPTLQVDGHAMTQSPAILEWLEEAHPEPPLLPSDPFERQRVRAMCAVIGSDVHALHNLRVIRRVAAMGGDGAAWARSWIEDGLAALEPQVARYGRGFAYGETPTLVDCYLVAQFYSLGRFGVDAAAFPALSAAVEHALAHPAVAAAHPDRQPDATPA